MATPTIRYINIAAVLLMVTAVIFIVYFVKVCRAHTAWYETETVKNTLENQKLRLQNEQTAACIVTCDSIKAIRKK